MLGLGLSSAGFPPCGSPLLGHVGLNCAQCRFEIWVMWRQSPAAAMLTLDRTGLLPQSQSDAALGVMVWDYVPTGCRSL